VVLCACTALHLLSVVFGVAGAMNKFHFRRVINETPNVGDQWTEGQAVRENRAFDRMRMLSCDRRPKS
jgi:hypothetical protein